MICQPFLSRYSGSEILTLELAAALTTEGAEVAIATWFCSEQMRDEVSSIPGSTVLLIDSDAYRLHLESHAPDVVWSHQGLVPGDLLASGARFVFAHLSSFNSFEYSFNPNVESSLAERVYFVSPEARDAQIATGMFEGFDPSVFRLLENPAPQAFHEVTPQDPRSQPGGLRSLLVVSNHLPPEVVEAIGELRDGDVDVTVVGLERGDVGATPLRVDADLVAGHDAVMSIGKTVQYGLCAGRAVFCYDHFGGPGWLTDQNVREARWHNFSGRGFTRRSGHDLVAELRSGFARAQEFASARVDGSREDFGYSRIVDDVAGLCGVAGVRAGGPGPAEWRGYTAAHRTVGDFGVAFYSAEHQIADRSKDLDRRSTELRGWEERVASAEAEGNRLRMQAEAERAERLRLATEVEALHRTLSWRVTRPLRAVRRILAGRRAH